MKVSIIIPCYNAASKIGRCFSSLRKIDFPPTDYEVIFVDDASTDSTVELVSAECARSDNWTLECLEVNSGSPSHPRNIGVARAHGDYIFFLDCDDEILPDTLRIHHHHAVQTDACIVRGYLFVDDGKKRKIANRIGDWSPILARKERIEKIVGKQSTTNTSLIKRALLLEKRILWPETIRMGEDTIFLLEILTSCNHVEYIDHPTFIYNKRPTLSLSSTQSYGARELHDHLCVWTTATTQLNRVGLDYRAVRLQVGMQNVIKSLIFRNRGDIDQRSFHMFSEYVVENCDSIDFQSYPEHHRNILKAAKDNNYESFCRLCRPKLVIAGHDLKFIKNLIPKLDKHYEIRIDQWTDHNAHNESESLDLLEWADFIWCEWMLGNAEWYSKNKRPHQRLIIRMHRQELATPFGTRLNVDNIDAVLAVSVLFFERLMEAFPNIPRRKVRLLPNFIDVDEYQRSWNDARPFTLGMIGILPSKKNFAIALNILVELRKHDKRYSLEIFSKNPKDLPWLSRQRAEMVYYEQCNQYIAENDLSDSVTFRGHSDLRIALQEYNVGVILSLSASQRELPGFESFHLAVADGFAGGGASLIQRWAGSEYIFPKEMICDSMADIVDRILAYRDNAELYREYSNRGLDFMRDNYGAEGFIESIRSIYLESL